MTSTKRATPPTAAPAILPVPQRSLVDANRVRYAGGYYDPDAAAFDDSRAADFESLINATAPVRPAPELARSAR
ncbi:MAG TPA: hypothetical protein VGC90_04095 [Candidatus Limnocylindrales bacterium]